MPARSVPPARGLQYAVLHARQQPIHPRPVLRRAGPDPRQHVNATPRARFPKHDSMRSRCADRWHQAGDQPRSTANRCNGCSAPVTRVPGSQRDTGAAVAPEHDGGFLHCAHRPRHALARRHAHRRSSPVPTGDQRRCGPDRQNPHSKPRPAVPADRVDAVRRVRLMLLGALDDAGRPKLDGELVAPLPGQRWFVAPAPRGGRCCHAVSVDNHPALWQPALAESDQRRCQRRAATARMYRHFALWGHATHHQRSAARSISAG